MTSASDTLFMERPQAVAIRGTTLGRIVFEISCGNELAVLEHPNHEKYPGEKIAIVQVDDYMFAVPFIETEAETFF